MCVCVCVCVCVCGFAAYEIVEKHLQISITVAKFIYLFIYFE